MNAHEGGAFLRTACRAVDLCLAEESSLFFFPEGR